MADFTSFQSLIPKALKKYKMERSARASLICEKFRSIAPRIIGDDCENFIHPKFVKDGVLFISVPSSIWGQKVFNSRHKIIEELNGNDEIVKDLKFIMC